MPGANGTIYRRGISSLESPKPSARLFGASSIPAAVCEISILLLCKIDCCHRRKSGAVGNERDSFPPL